jgi:tyrosyl-tRNA synthetase
VPRSELSAGIGVLTLFVRAGLAASNGEARRQIKGGGLRVDDEIVTDERALVARSAPDAVIKLSVGRKKHALVKAV